MPPLLPLRNKQNASFTVNLKSIASKYTRLCTFASGRHATSCTSPCTRRKLSKEKTRTADSPVTRTMDPTRPAGMDAPGTPWTLAGGYTNRRQGSSRTPRSLCCASLLNSNTKWKFHTRKTGLLQRPLVSSPAAPPPPCPPSLSLPLVVLFCHPVVVCLYYTSTMPRVSTAAGGN